MSAPAVPRYLEDFAPGQTFGSGRTMVEAAAVADFAGSFDPQPAHLDAASADATVFRGIAASGWHTAALTMRLLVASEFRPEGGIVGLRAEIDWPRPVRPGDTLELQTEVVGASASRLRPGQGTLQIRVTTLNQHAQPVMTMLATLRALARPSSGPA